MGIEELMLDRVTKQGVQQGEQKKATVTPFYLQYTL